MLVDTASLSGAILLIIGTATAMAWALTQSGFSRSWSPAMAQTAGRRGGFLVVSIVAVHRARAGARRAFRRSCCSGRCCSRSRARGVNEVHYAIVAVLAMGIGLFAPPFGVGYYAACAIGRVPAEAAMNHMWRYLGALAVGLAIVVAIPWLTTCLL